MGILKEHLLYDLDWLLLGLPLAAFLGLISARSKRAAAWTAIVFTGLDLVLGLAILVSQIRQARTHPSPYTFVQFANGGEAPPQTVLLSLGVNLDQLAAIAVVAVLVSVLALMVHAMISMRGEEAYVPFFRNLVLTTVALLGLATAGSFFQVAFYWGLLSVTGYLLLNVRRDDVAHAAATRVYMLVAVLGDMALLVAIAYLQFRFGDLNFATLAGDYHNGHAGEVGLSLVGLLLLVALIARGAQFPLQAWSSRLEDAPTAPLALVQGLAVVGAVGLVAARAYPLLAASEISMALLATIGVFTLILASLLALAATDIRRIVALVGVAELGVVLVGFGSGAYSTAVAHLLVAGALVTALALATGTLVRSMRTAQIFQMGGVQRRMPLTAITTLLIGLSLSGVPPLSPFFTQSGIVASTFHSGKALIGALFLLGAMSLALALLRAWLVVFLGETVFRRAFDPKKIREGRSAMTRSVLALALLASVAGFFALPWSGVPHKLNWFSRFVYTGRGRTIGFELLPVLLLLVAIAAGAALALALYRRRTATASELRSALEPGPAMFERGLHFDAAQTAVGAFAVRLGGWFDRFELAGLRRAGTETVLAIDDAARAAGRGAGASLPAYGLAVGLSLLLIVLLYGVAALAGR